MAPTRRTGRYASTGGVPVASSLPWSTPRAARARSTSSVAGGGIDAGQGRRENPQPVGELGIVGRGHMGLEDGRLEFEVLLHAPEDHVELAHDELEQVDLGLEELENPFLDGSPGDEVDEQDIARLVDSVDPPEA